MSAMVDSLNSLPVNDSRTSEQPLGDVDNVGEDSSHASLVADVFQRGCDSRATLEVVAGKWGVLALAALRDGSIRFNALRRKVDGVSEKMLAQTLQSLERDGLVIREVREAIPPHVEYTLSPLGEKLSEHLLELIDVIEDAVPQIVTARTAYDARRGA